MNYRSIKYKLPFVLAGSLSVILWYFLRNYFEELQLLLLVTGLLILFFSFLNTDIALFIIIFTLFIPLSLGTFLGIPYFLIFEIFTPIFAFYVIINKLLTKKEFYFTNRNYSPFFYWVFFYFIWIFFEFTRYSIGSGIRTLFTYFLCFLLTFTFAELINKENKKRILLFIFYTVLSVVVIGLGVIFIPGIKNSIMGLQEMGLLAYTNTVLVSSWKVGNIVIMFGGLRVGLLQSTAPIGLLFLLSGLFKIPKGIRITGIGLFFLALVLSGGRSFFAGTLIAIVFFIYLKKGWKSIPVILIITLVIYLLVFISYEALPGPLRRVFFWKAELKYLDPGRFALFNLLLKGIKSHPIIGKGFGSYKLIDYHNDLYNFLIMQLSYGGHGTFISLLYITGIVGLLAFVVMYAKSIVLSYKLYRTTGEKPEFLLLLLYFIYAFFPLAFGGKGSDGAFFLFIGLLFGMCKVAKIEANK